MKELIGFFLKLAIPFILVFAGVAMIKFGLDYEIAFLAWTGLASRACGLLYGVWLYISNGISLWDD